MGSHSSDEGVFECKEEGSCLEEEGRVRRGSCTLWNVMVAVWSKAVKYIYIGITGSVRQLNYVIGSLISMDSELGEVGRGDR
jgi:hypothetical protein